MESIGEISKGKVMTFESMYGMSREAYDKAKRESDEAQRVEAEAEAKNAEGWRPL